MDFRQLEAFVRTVELGSFSKTAEAMYLSQPSISVYVRTLEDELGVRLLTRTAKIVSPTKDGKLFYQHAKNMLTLREKALVTIQNEQQSFQGEISLYASSVPAQFILPEVIADFNKSFPEISFYVNMMDTFKVVNTVLEQKCDLGLVGAKIEEGRCTFRFITAESIVLIAPLSSPLSAENLTRQIYFENFIVREAGSATRYHAEEYLLKIGINRDKLRIVAQLTNMQSIVYAVSKGLGISIVSELAARDYILSGLVTVIRPKDFELRREFWFVSRKDAILSSKQTLFIDFVCDYYRNKGFTQEPAAL